jgi:hypothetical protein
MQDNIVYAVIRESCHISIPHGLPRMLTLSQQRCQKLDVQILIKSQVYELFIVNGLQVRGRSHRELCF